MRIGLLECDDVMGRFPHIKGGYREMFAALLEPHVPGLQFSYYPADRGKLPSSPLECGAWLCTGSKYSVYEKHGWIAELAAFMREVHKAAKPFVGICFGHQMLAHSLGGEVGRARQGWGVGVLRVDVLVHEPWMEPAQAGLWIHHMHQDQVARLPSGSVLLARSDHCEMSMFRAGRMLGIEGHPEFTVPFSEALIRSRVERIGTERAQRALEGLSQPTDGALAGRWIAKFLQATA
jgi:GMP synthase-like glutamine amidotransferase